jgi:hypothetical protein
MPTSHRDWRLVASHRRRQSSWTNLMLPLQAQGRRRGRSASAGKRQMRHWSPSSSSDPSAAEESAISGGGAAAILREASLRPSLPSSSSLRGHLPRIPLCFPADTSTSFSF